jgi:hypothetical protein
MHYNERNIKTRAELLSKIPRSDEQYNGETLWKGELAYFMPQVLRQSDK